MSSMTRSETIQVSGIRCENCVSRLAAALRGHEGLNAATANLIGQVTLEWDDEQTTREELVGVLERAGFREQPFSDRAASYPSSIFPLNFS
jgi:copper chaperone CopZ